MNFRVASRGPLGSGPQAISRFRLEQAVVQGLEAWWTGSYAQIVRDHFSPDALLLNHCPRHLSCFGGAHRGHAAIVSGFARLISDFLVADPSVSHILMDGFHVAASYSVALRHVGTGRSSRIAGMAHVTLDAKLRISQVENFFDSAGFAEVADLLEDFAARSEALDRMGRAALAAQDFGARGG
jgi:SnoaL-like domain